MPIALALLAALPAAAQPPQAPRAFPTAEGYGANAVGGRGGVVIYVDNLEDSGLAWPGCKTLPAGCSLRSALGATVPRTVLFRVGGTISLQSELVLAANQSYLTVAGQTAPGDGIQLKNFGLMLRDGVHDVVLRYLRIRPGLAAVTPEDFSRYDALTLWNAHDVIVDHCSLEWGPDASVSVWGASERVTLQWNLIAESPFGESAGASHGLNAGGEADRNHQTLTLHHNLIANVEARAPRVVQGSRTDIRNNVTYGWDMSAAAGLGDYQSRHAHQTIENIGSPEVNFVGNYFKAGSLSNDGIGYVGGLRTRVYLEGNVTPGCPGNCASPWEAMFAEGSPALDLVNPGPYGVRPLQSCSGTCVVRNCRECFPAGDGMCQGGPSFQCRSRRCDGGPFADKACTSHAHCRDNGRGCEVRGFTLEDKFEAPAPFATPPVMTTSAVVAYEQVLDDVGATRPVRDPLDVRIVHEVRTDTGAIGCGATGRDCIEPDDWPTLVSGPVAPDGDGDGMPDSWELDWGLNPNDAADGNRDGDGNGYPDLEDYLNGAGPVCVAPDGDLDGFTACHGECDDGDPASYPGAPERCDGVNNDCADPDWPALPPSERDADGDGWAACSECDDGAAWTYPDAPQRCDGVNRNCSDPDWPEPPDEERDRDRDGFSTCAGDCNDSDFHASPAWNDSCNGLDDDCDGSTDESPTCPRCAAPVDVGPRVVLDSAVGGAWGAVDLVRTRDGYAAAWLDRGKLLVAIVDTSGMSPRAPRAFPETISHARLVYAGSQLGIAFVDLAGRLGFRQVASDLTEIEVHSDLARPSPPVAGWNGLEFAVPGFAGNRLHVTRIRPTGFRLDPVRNDYAIVPADLAWDGGRWALLGTDGQALRFSALTPEGVVVGEPRPLGAQALAGNARLIWTGSSHGAFWTNAGRVEFVRLDRNGAPQTPIVVLSPAPAPHTLVDVAWDGAHFLVTWSSDDDDFGGVFDAAGQSLGPYLENASVDGPQVAWDGNSLAMLYADRTNGSVHLTHFACCFDAEGDDLCGALDNCPDVYNPGQHDPDGDDVGSACDNCPFAANASQADFDQDAEGDHCDRDDGMPYLRFASPQGLFWAADSATLTSNLYRGSLGDLVDHGSYTQPPGANPEAARWCGLLGTTLVDVTAPAPGRVAFYLVTGVRLSGEGSLGVDSRGLDRPNTLPCP